MSHCLLNVIYMYASLTHIVEYYMGSWAFSKLALEILKMSKWDIWIVVHQLWLGKVCMKKVYFWKKNIWIFICTFNITEADRAMTLTSFNIHSTVCYVQWENISFMGPIFIWTWLFISTSSRRLNEGVSSVWESTWWAANL
jgi:hypothetical protein